MKLQARAYVEANRPVPPLSFEELRKHADTFVAMHQHDPIYRDYAAVLLSSKVWRDPLAARVEQYLRSLGSGDGLDFIHLSCLARCWAALPPDVRRTAR